MTDDRDNILAHGGIDLPRLADGRYLLKYVWNSIEFEGRQRDFTITIGCADAASVPMVMKRVKDAGGVFVSDENDRNWFLPWPPKAVLIERVVP